MSKKQLKLWLAHARAKNPQSVPFIKDLLKTKKWPERHCIYPDKEQ